MALPEGTVDFPPFLMHRKVIQSRGVLILHVGGVNETAPFFLLSNQRLSHFRLSSSRPGLSRRFQERRNEKRNDRLLRFQCISGSLASTPPSPPY